MRILILVYSYTNHTYSVANRLKERLLKDDHLVVVKRIKALDDEPLDNNIIIEQIHDTSNYDIIIYAAMVRSFTLAPVMVKYLKQMKGLNGQKVYGFVTEHFPYPWMGDNQAINKMKQLLLIKGTNIIDTDVINWSNKNRDNQIDNIFITSLE